MRIVGGRLRGLKLAEIGAGDPAAHLAQTDHGDRHEVTRRTRSAMAADPT